MKELECKLAERDAMIRVLQKKHTLDKEVSSSYPSISLDTVPTLNTTDLNVLAADNLGGKHILFLLTINLYKSPSFYNYKYLIKL